MNIENIKKAIEEIAEESTRKIQEEAKKAIEELEQNTIEEYNPSWLPEKGGHYWCVDSYCGVLREEYGDDKIDRHNILTFNVYKTEKLAEQKLKWLEIRKKIFDIACELGMPTKNDWENNNNSKYFLIYDFDNKKTKIDLFSKGKESQIYCLEGRKFLDKCLKDIGEEDLKFYLTSNFI